MVMTTRLRDTSESDTPIRSVYDADITVDENEASPDPSDNDSQMAVPHAWEPQPQLALPTLDVTDLDNASPDDRQRRCQALLGHIQHSFRQISEQAHVVRARVIDDGQQGHRAIMARPACEDDTHARSRALEALSTWHYADGQGEKETTLYMGAVGASNSTINAVIELNRRKAAFSYWLQQLKEALGQKSGKVEMAKLYAVLVPEAPLNVRRKVAGQMVRELLHKRLNIRQLTRQIPVVPVNPDKISWRWSTTPSTLKIARADLIELLEQRGDVEARYDLQTLANEPAQLFSWHKGETEDCRISVNCASAFEKQDKDKPMLKQRNLSIKSRLPVFYLDTGKQRPEFRVAPEDAPKYQRATRTERQPFLLSLPIHRYLATE